MARILVVGAGGFIGRALCPALASGGRWIVAGLRRPAQKALICAESRLLGDLARPTLRRGMNPSGIDWPFLRVYLFSRGRPGLSAPVGPANVATCGSVSGESPERNESTERT
ncbi:MAG TPA: NAD-dependent epimerase/dehydratase family protein [Stellaceae bacterium]|nr:NAD-dependent epimerase/dehydratase family protein [Stellaceae bacterium]